MTKKSDPSRKAASNATAPASPAPARRESDAPKDSAIFSREEIEIRAFLISEKRRADGTPGDEQQDWIEAERQVMAERTASRPRPA